MAQGNINLLFFFVGLAMLAPLGCLLLNVLWELIFSNTPDWMTVPLSLWKMDAATAEACNLFTSSSSVLPITMNVVPSYWLTIMAFFCTYLFLNANNLYNKQSSSKASKAAIEARKNQTMISMIIVSLAAVLFTLVRYSTSCETGVGVIVSWLLGGSLAQGWYSFMRQCGLGRLDDIFGISNRLLPMQSYEEPNPTMCVPT